MAKAEERDFGEMLIQGMREALAIARGEMEPERISRRSLGALPPDTPPPQPEG